MFPHILEKTAFRHAFLCEYVCMYYALIPPSSLFFVFLQESGTEAHQDGMCITPNALVKERSQNKQLSMFTRWTNLFLLAELFGNKNRPTSIFPQVALLVVSYFKAFRISKWPSWISSQWIHSSQFMDTILVLRQGNFLAIAVATECTTPLPK